VMPATAGTATKAIRGDRRAMSVTAMTPTPAQAKVAAAVRPMVSVLFMR
jgi:hypothetical protein